MLRCPVDLPNNAVYLTVTFELYFEKVIYIIFKEASGCRKECVGCVELIEKKFLDDIR
jgi:hypothetical protein